MSRPNELQACERAPRKQRLVVRMVGSLLSLTVSVAGAQYIATSEALAQEHASHAAGQAFEPLVDGSLTPYLIPDDLAIRAFMKSLRVPGNPSTSVVERLSARVARLNLSDSDLQILVREIVVLDARAQEQEVRIEATRPSEGAERAEVDRFVEEQVTLNLIMVDHYQRLLAALSPEGVAKLHDHILHVKSRTKIYPGMSSRITN